MIDIGSLWDFSDAAGSEARFRDAAARAEGAERAVLLTQVARALGLQDRFDDGHEVLDAVDADRAVADAPEVATRVALERGRLRRSGGDPDAAQPEFVRAFERATAAGLDALAVDALHMRAILEHGDDARATLTQALALAHSSTDPAARAWRASLLNNLGMTHADEGDWPQALTAFEDALAAREQTGPPDSVRVARWMVAWALRNLGRGEEALAIQRALRAEHEAAGTDDPYVREELALLERDGS